MSEFQKLKGQLRLKQQLKIVLNKRKIPHMGLFGPTGSGKTTLAYLIAEAIEAKIIYFNGTAVKNSISFVQKAYEANKDPDRHHIIFIDEAHKLPKAIQENMLSILEEPAVINCTAPKSGRYLRRDPMGELTPTVVTKGQTIEVCLPNNISFILGTTHKGQLRDAILNRIENLNFDEYEIDTVTGILIDANVTNPPIPKYFLEKIARISRDNRDAKHILESLESYLDLINVNPINLNEKNFSEFCNIHSISPIDGCKSIDIVYMNTIAQYSVIGLKSLSSMIGIPVDEIEDKIEPWLLKKQYIRITPKGRELTPKGMQRLNIDPSQLDDTIIISG